MHEKGDKYDGLIHNNKMDYSKLVSVLSPLDLFMPCLKEINSEKFIHTSYEENDLIENKEIENISPMKKLFNEIKDEINIKVKEL